MSGSLAPAYYFLSFLGLILFSFDKSLALHMKELLHAQSILGAGDFTKDQGAVENQDFLLKTWVLMAPLPLDSVDGAEL